MNTKAIHIERLATMSPRPCMKCGKKFLKAPGWRAFGPDPRGFGGKGFKFACIECCPTAEAAHGLFTNPATWA